MLNTVFYSWQSDIPDNRNLIEHALRQAVKDVAAGTLSVEPSIDKALKNAPGALRIDHDILGRIMQCAAFVGDVTLVTAPDRSGRPSPNPNVLFELGFALRCLGWERIILPFNSAYGSSDDLPFDLEKNRLLNFKLAPEAGQETAGKVKAELVRDFTAAIKAICRIPVLKDRLAAFFNQINPAILQAVRAGRKQVTVLISPHRLGELQQLVGSPAASELVQCAATGRALSGPGNRSDVIPDVLGVMKQEFILNFKNNMNW